MGANNRKEVKIPAGVYRGSTDAKSAALWYETNLVRWVEDELRPVGGWERIVADTPASTIRAMHIWADNSGNLHKAVLCEGHVYILESDGTLTDISPTVALAQPSDSPSTGGYGDFDYGDGTYGTARPDRVGINFNGPAFTMGNWGEDLLVMSSVDGRLLRWQPSTPATPCTAVTGAPTGNRTFVVTPERHVMLFQKGGSPRTWGWSDQEDIENWNLADTTSLAGEYDIEPAAPIIAAKATRGGVVLWTAVGVYFTRYVGLPYVYSNAEKIQDNATPISAQGILSVSDRLYWFADDGFWELSGGTVNPIPCPLYDWMKLNRNEALVRWISAGVALGLYPEVWWFYPSTDALDNDRYICYHVNNKWWSMGKLARTCGVSGAHTVYPYMSDGVNIFIHEKGDFYYDASELPYAITGTLNLSGGVINMTLLQGIVDTGSTTLAPLFDFYAKDGRFVGAQESNKLNVPVRTDGYIDIRNTGRDHRIKVKSAYNGVGQWTFGAMLIEFAQRGKR